MNFLPKDNFFKMSGFICLFSLMLKSCLVVYDDTLPFNDAHELSKNSNTAVSVAEITWFNDGSGFNRAKKYKFLHEGDTLENYQSLMVSGIGVEFSFMPEGGKYMMVYNPKRPKFTGANRFFMNQPVYDSTQVFERIEGRVIREFFINNRTPVFYGGLQLIFKYNVNGKEYESHNGITLHEVFPDIKNPEEELSFVGKKFVVEYDVSNPYIARILLDEEVK